MSGDLGEADSEQSDNRERRPVELHTPPRMIAVWIVDILIYGFGAACCGALVMRWHLQAVWLPVAIVSAVIVYSYFTQNLNEQGSSRSESSI